MHMLIFEVMPGPDRMNEYLDIASRLKIELDRSGGCSFIERFRRLDDPERLLSFQLWDNEESLCAWRNNRSHKEVQIHARNNMFSDYRLRVARIVDRETALEQSPERTVAVFQSNAPYLKDRPPEGCRTAVFSSVYRQGRYVHLVEPGAADHAALELFCQANHNDECHVGLVTRDYGMFERGEAPPLAPM